MPKAGLGQVLDLTGYSLPAGHQFSGIKSQNMTVVVKYKASASAYTSRSRTINDSRPRVEPRSGTYYNIMAERYGGLWLSMVKSGRKEGSRIDALTVGFSTWTTVWRGASGCITVSGPAVDLKLCCIKGQKRLHRKPGINNDDLPT